jgi:tubulin--tyrosine ligase
MSSSLAKKRSIALSYGMVVDPTPTTYVNPAHVLACRIMNYLWYNWGSENSGLRQGEVDLYSINIPMIEDLLADQGLKISWTTLLRNSYGRLFENIAEEPEILQRHGTGASGESWAISEAPESKVPKNQVTPLLFKWSPDIGGLINPTVRSLPVGSDAWAIHNGRVSVTPLRAAFAEPYCAKDNDGSVREMKL